MSKPRLVFELAYVTLGLWAGPALLLGCWVVRQIVGPLP